MPKDSEGSGNVAAGAALRRMDARRRRRRKTRRMVGESSQWSLEDIGDVRRYAGQVVRVHLATHLTQAEFDEALDEGVAAIWILHRGNPVKDADGNVIKDADGKVVCIGGWNREKCPSFADYCSTYLPFRLIDWWRREMRQRNVCRRNGRDGTYEYSGVASVEAMTERGTELMALGDGRLGD